MHSKRASLHIELTPKALKQTQPAQHTGDNPSFEAFTLMCIHINVPATIPNSPMFKMFARQVATHPKTTSPLARNS